MKLIEKIKKDLKKISKWPWEATQCSPASLHFHHMSALHWRVWVGANRAPVLVIAEEPDAYFIARSPERIAALVEYVEAAEAQLSVMRGPHLVIYKQACTRLEKADG